MIRQSTSISPVVLLPLLLLLTIQTQRCWSLIPLLDGGKDIPKLNNGYRAYFDSQIAKQASAAVGAAIGSGKTNMEGKKRKKIQEPRLTCCVPVITISSNSYAPWQKQIYRTFSSMMDPTLGS